MSTVSKDLTCLVIYHPDNRDEARCLESIVTNAGFKCKLLFECSRPYYITEIFRLADKADCIISLITRQLLDDQQFKYHQKVYDRLNERFIPVIRDVSDQRLKTDINLAFLGGCRLLRCSDAKFIEDLVNVIKATLAEWNRTTAIHDERNHAERPSSQGEDATSKVEQPHVVRRVLPSKPTPRPTSGQHERRRTLPETILTSTGIPTSSVEDHGSVTATEQHSDCIDQNTELVATKLATEVDDLSASEQRSLLLQGAISKTSSSQTVERSSVQEENKGQRLGKGSSSEVYLYDYTCSDGRVIQAAVKILNQHHKSEKHFNREKSLASVRSPFLLPILKVVDRPGERFQLIIPYMKNGSLEAMLKLKESTWAPTIDTRSRLLVIMYHVCQAVATLHKKRYVHGDVNPSNILLDEFWNARLADYGRSVSLRDAMEERESDQTFEAHFGYSDPYAKTTGAKSFQTDLFSLGVTFLQMLKYRSSTFFEKTQDADGCERWKRMSLFDCLLKDNNEKLPEALDLVTDERYIETSVWPNDEISLGVITATLMFLSPQGPSRVNALVNLLTFLKTDAFPGRAVITLPPDRCGYCYVGNPNRDLQLTVLPSCTPGCAFLNMCHSCWIPVFSHGPIVCPNHDGYIYAPIGGKKAYALIISGRDRDNSEIQKNILADTKAIERVVEHPRIMNVPRANIFRISAGENDTSKDIIEVMRKIVASKPDFFLLYYSGHNDQASEKLDVSDKQQNSLDVEEIRRVLMDPLRADCPRVLVILDCCYAERLDLLHGSSRNPHTLWHVKLASCGAQEASNIETGDLCSVFTKCIVACLEGARRCPNKNNNCASCKDFRETGHRKKFTTDTSLNKYVQEHVMKRHRDDRDDVQTPLRESTDRQEAVIAYFTDEPLYRFNVELPNEPSGDPCCLDSIDDSVDDILVELWNILNEKGRLPRHLDHKVLQIYQRTGKKMIPLNTFGEIIDVVHDDKNTLYVRMRLEGSELEVDKWVACICDRVEAESLMEKLSPSPIKTARTGGGQGTVWKLRELDTKLTTPVAEPFGAVLVDCWQKYHHLHQAKLVADTYYMRVETCDGLAMFSIAK